MSRRFACVSLLALLGITGCAAEKPSNANQYFNLASANLRQGAYNQAVENYRNLLDEYPFSEYSEEAELKIGIAQYKNGSCPEATAAFTDFQRRHPTSPYLPLVGYMLGKCAEEQMRPSDRDQSAAQNAHAYYQALIQQHPTSPYAELARQKLERCRETLADHELVVAEYYARHKNNKAAETRLLDLVNRFNDTDVAGDALFQLGELYRKEDQNDKAILAFAAVEYYHPDHDDAPQAKRELEQLLEGEAPPTGDPLAVLKAETGRTRSIAIAQTARPVQDQKQQARRGGAAPSGNPTGFGLPGAAGPFGRGGGTGGPYGTRGY
jgi:outer membrane protein assembly factor BamD